MLDLVGFEKNVKRWSKFCPENAKALAEMDCSDVKMVNTGKNLPNLSLSVEGQQCYYHSESDPVEEARDWVKALDLKDIQVLYVFGLGLGYVYDWLKDWLRISYAHTLVFLEPNPSVIHRLLETERGTEMLFDQQVYIYPLDAQQTIIDQISDLFFLQPYKVLALNLYARLLPRDLANLKSRLAFDMNLKKMASQEFQSYGLGYLNNYFRNVFYLPRSSQGDGLFGRFTGIPAIICGAGPSIAKNRHLLEKLRDRAIIFAGGTAMNAINAAGVLPHFGVGIDPNKDQFTRIIMNMAYETPFFYRMRWLYDALQIIHGDRLYITGSSGYKIGKWLEHRFEIEGNDIDEGCNVINFSLSIAAAMGCNPIIFVGVDLAYTDSQSYAPGLINHPLHNLRQHFRTKETSEELIVKSDIYGKPIYTLWKWVTESLWFSSFAAQNPRLTLINSTEGGLGFPGVINLPLADVADRFLRKQLPLELFIHGEIQNSRMPSGLTPDTLRESMEVFAISLLSCMNICTKIQIEFADLFKKAQEGEAVPENLETVTLKQLKEELHRENAFIYLLEGFIPAYDKLNSLSKSKLDWNQDIMDPQTYMQKKIEYEAKRYLFLSETARLNGKLLHSIINEQSQKAKQLEAQTARNKPAPLPPPYAPGTTYSFANNVLKIADPEFELNFEEKFIPDTTGRIKFIYPDGKVKQEAYNLEGKLHGPATFYAQNGAILAQAWYIRGLRQGKSVFYYPTGALQSLQRFKDGQWHGKQEYYYPDGTVRSVLNYNKGKLDGDVFLYQPTGKFARELHYKDGKRNGVERIWNDVGLLLIEAFFKDDQPTGTARHWYTNGNLAVECIYSDKDGSCLMHRWDENGLPIAEEQLVSEDYFDKVAKQTNLLTKSLENMYQQVNSFIPIFNQVLPSDRQETTMKGLQSDLLDLKEKMDHLRAVSKEMVFEFENPKEPIWKTPSSQKEIQSKLDVMSKEMSKDILQIQEAFAQTVRALTEKAAKGQNPPPPTPPTGKG